jgi:hypothetical protein
MRATTPAWYEFFGQADHSATNDPLAALRSAGIALERRGRDGHGAGIVFFDRITSQLGEFLREVSRGGAERVLAVAMPSAIDERDGSPWTLLQLGASDVIVWDRSRNTAAEIAARFERWQEIDALLDSPLVRNNLIGTGREWRATLRHVVEVARFTDASVLILGESGTGKELIARLIHALDPRPDKRDLIVLDCTTVVPELAGSEFFGHERGAFTGAFAPRDGAFALAHGGTLFLDEIGDLPLALQAQLAGTHLQARRRKRLALDAVQAALRDAPPAIRGRRARVVPSRLVLPNRRRRLSSAAAASQTRGHPAPVPALPRADVGTNRAAGGRRAGASAPAEASLSGQRARA